jgi:diguanylate cyclase (GGDEF)-like protein
MDILLWRWSTAIQVVSLTMIAVFFVALSRSVRRVELHWWTRAWLANLAALAVTLLFWYLQPGTDGRRLAGSLYLGAKLSFVLLLLQGAWSVMRPGAVLLSAARGTLVVATYTVFGAVFLSGVERLGFVHHTVMGLLFAAGAWVVLRAPDSGLSWLGTGMAIRSALCLVEAAAYGATLPPLFPLSEGVQGAAQAFLSAHSSLDTVAEWLIVLGSVLAFSERGQRELRQANEELLAAQEHLRGLADRDPLTGLANTRALPGIFRAVQPAGATVLFFDLDGLKDINDVQGHQAGDEHLRRFARALGDCFRPSDAVVRYAGDEFVVVATGLTRAAVAERVDRLRVQLRRPPDGGPIAFSVGVAELPPGGQPDLALQAADQAMYASRSTRFPVRRSAH